MNIQGYAQQAFNPQYTASQNPVLPVNNQQTNTEDFTEALHVDGFEGARTCKLPPNCKSTIAYDNKLPMVYFIFVVDGERKVSGFDTTPHPEPKPVTTDELNRTLQAIDQRLKNLEDDYNGLNSRFSQENGGQQSGNASNKQRSDNSSNASRH